MRFLSVCCVVGISMIVGCSNPSGNSLKDKKDAASHKAVSVKVNQPGDVVVVKEKKAFKPFYIYANKGSRNNHYAPSGFMPSGKCLKFVDMWEEDCYSGSTCMKIVYDIECSREEQRWAGIYWLNPPNNWGSRKGGFNLVGAEKLTFWAKGKNGGEQIEEFKIGGIEGNYPDSDVAVIGPVILSSEWKKYTVDLRGKDLSYISGGFAWSANEDMNPAGCEFYLDEIRFE